MKFSHGILHTDLCEFHFLLIYVTVIYENSAYLKVSDMLQISLGIKLGLSLGLGLSESIISDI